MSTFNKVKSKKMMIRTSSIDISGYDFEGSLEGIKNQIERWISTYGKNAKLKWDPTRSTDWTGDPDPGFYLIQEREETDEEYNIRLKQEAEFESENLRREKEEYERLKAKFESKE